MRFALAAALLCSQLVRAQSLVPQVKASLEAGNFAAAQNSLAHFRQASGATPEYLEAFSWIGRASLAAKRYPEALSNAVAVRDLCLRALTKRSFDAESHLPTALGASIEVQAQALAATGHRDQAIAFLNAEETRWHATSIRARIQKNLNLLDLEGKPAPPLERSSGLNPVRAALPGHPALLFFWAHWCPDCKQEVAVIRQLQKEFGPRGLVVIAPTQRYGYVAGGEEAGPAVEDRYIRAVRDRYYAALGNIEMPLSQENFGRYGVSTTPTLVLLDGQGVVRMYHPGLMTYAELANRTGALARSRGR